MFSRSKPHKDREKDDRDRDRDKDKERPRKSPRHPADEKKRRKKSRATEDTTSDLLDPDRPPISPSSQSRRRRHTSTEKSDRAMDDAPPSRGSLPYPNFSKAHSRESILPTTKSQKSSPAPAAAPVDILTPDATEIGADQEHPPQRNGAVAGQTATGAPPSPPLTSVDDVNQNIRIQTPVEPPRRSDSAEPSEISKASTSKTAKSSSTIKPDEQKGGLRQHVSSRPSSAQPGTSRPSPTQPGALPFQVTVEDGSSVGPRPPSAMASEVKSAVDSEATSRLGGRGNTKLELFPVEPDSGGIMVSPITPTQSAFSMGSHFNRAPNIAEAFPPSMPPTPFDTMSPQPPPPPPPPPPPFIPNNAPKVDYLLNNGGLSHTVPRTLLAARSSQTASFQSSQPSTPNYNNANSKSPHIRIEDIFAPFHTLLDDYASVLNKNGSLAVATGYKSVARRLLGRLENVFARDISSQSCTCVMCQQNNRPEVDDERVGWGEVLEWVGGRRDTPPWPPFDFENLGEPQLGAFATPQASIRSPSRVSLRIKTPLQQNIDADVPEECRDHYIRQSAKTKKTVDKWLMSQPGNASAPPPEVDNETLTFTILTHLNPDDRPIFSALLASPPSLPVGMHPDARAQTPAKPARSEFLTKSGSAIQRLYRLPSLPRDPETALYLLRHQHLHNVLATLSAINNSEWDILTSGRFDGFLWSGAEEPDRSSSTTRINTPHNWGPSRGPSRGPQNLPSRMGSRAGISPAIRGSSTPFQNIDEVTASRGPTPFQSPGGKPVPLDEEQEIAALAEIEREIFNGMEALEDSFEALHRKAESIRQRVRERGAGLSSMATVSGVPNNIEVVAGTPGPANVSWAYPSPSEVDDESDAGDIPPWRGLSVAESVASELAPDDSASNISSSRHRRPKRRTERRTPAPLEEESEDDFRT